MEIKANIAGKGLAQIEIQRDRISSVRVVGPTDPEELFVSPGLVDIQVNGFAGVDFADPELDPERAISILPAIWKTGVTTFCPTLITNTLEQLERSFRTLEEARRLDARFAGSVPCCHLEGPYLSPGRSHGAHVPALMRSPDWGEFSRLQEAAGGKIAIVTLAPELPGACDFIRRACATGVVVALGHTDATPEQIHQAIDAGASLATHLGNGCPEYVHRHQNPLWAQLASDRLKVSLICDGFHLPPDLVRVAFRMKGADGCILITDAIHAATLPPGRYSLVGREIEVLPTGQVVTADRQSMAGSVLSLNRAVSVFTEYTQAPLEHALRAATSNPARLLRSYEICAQLAKGQIANAVLFNLREETLDIKAVFLKGEVVYAAPSISAPAGLEREK
jgi:N-acetylglucosamine-6-phosphate deacetylase